MSARTGLSPAGVSRAVNASYAGKGSGLTKALGPFSRLHMAGHSRAYAIDNYAGKAPPAPGGGGGTIIPTIARRGRRGR